MYCRLFVVTVIVSTCDLSLCPLVYKIKLYPETRSQETLDWTVS